LASVVGVGLKMLLVKEGFEDESTVFDVFGESKVEENRNVEVCGVNAGVVIPPNKPPSLGLAPVVEVVVPPFTPFYNQPLFSFSRRVTFCSIPPVLPNLFFRGFASLFCQSLNHRGGRSCTFA